MKIGHKLTLGFFVVALLVGVVGYLAVDASQKALQESIGESSVSLAVEVLDEIDRGIYNKIERFQSFQDPSLQETIAKSNQEFEKLHDIQSYINEKDKEWTSAPKQEITPFMKDLINKELSKALRKRVDFYEEKHGLRVFAEVFVTNKYGANVGQTGRTTDYRQFIFDCDFNILRRSNHINNFSNKPIQVYLNLFFFFTSDPRIFKHTINQIMHPHHLR